MGRPGSGRFVGREEELHICVRVLDDVVSGEPETVLILGEAGLGKSRLAAAYADEVRQRNGLVLTSHGLDLDGGELPYGLVSELLRDVERQLGPERLRGLLDHGLEALEPLAPPTSIPAPVGPVDRVLVLAGVVALLERLADSGPVCWWVEDLQWADEPSRDIVRYVSRVAEGRPLLLLATVRTGTDGTPPRELDELVRDPGVESLRLTRLDPLQAQQLVADLTQGVEMSVAEADRIVQLSDGIPFFVEELAAGHGRGLPDSVRGLMLHRLEGLPKPARDLLAAVATAGGPVDFGDVVAVIGASEDDVGEPLDTCVHRGLLELGGEGALVGFRHALLAEAVLESLLPQVRRGWHRRWATRLDAIAGERPGTSDLLFARARHWYAAADATTAFTSAVEAARTAHDAEAHTEEAYHWGHVHGLWLANDAPAGLTHQDMGATWFMATWLSGQKQAARGVLEALRESPDLRDDWLVEAFTRQMDLHLRRLTGEPTGPGLEDDALDDLLARLSSQPASRMAAETLHYLVHEHEDRRPDIREPAYDVLESMTPPDADVDWVIENHRHRALLAAERGDHEEALRRHRAGLDAAARSGLGTRVYAARDVCVTLWAQGRLQEALDAVEPMIAAVEAGGRLTLPRWGDLVGMYSLVLCESGRWAEARDHATRVVGRTGATYAEVDARIVLTRIALRQRRYDDAQEAAGVDEPPEGAWFDERWGVLHPRLEVAAHLADRSTVRDLGARLWELPTSGVHGSVATFTLLVFARALLEPRSGEVDPDDVTLVESLAERFAYGGAFARASGAELAALVAGARGESTATAWRTVAEAWVAAGQPYDEALARVRLAAATATEGDPAEAAEQLRLAQQTAAALPSEWLAERIHVVAQLHGLRVRGAGRPITAGAGPLTAREHEVLGLMAEGLTNPEIGDRLFMSPKTASVHVSRIISKLGVRNRTEAATLAQRSGLVPVPGDPESR